MKRIIAIILIISMITGCAQNTRFKNSNVSIPFTEKHTTPDDIKNQNNQQKEEIEHSVDPLEIKPYDKSVTLNFKDVSLETLLSAVSKKTGINFITENSVKNIKFSAYLENVSVIEALDALLSAHGLVYEQFPDANIFVVKQGTSNKPRLTTRIYKLKYIQLSQAEAPKSKGGAKAGAKAGAKSGAKSGGDDQNASSNIITILSSILSEQGSLNSDPYTNSLIITDIPELFPQINSIIKSLDIMPPQICIEAEIIEMNSNDARELGINYSGTFASITGPSRVVQFPGADYGGGKSFYPSQADLEVGSPKFPGQFGGNNKTGVSYGILSFQDFTAILRAIEVTGSSDYLARPKIMTINNSTAEINIAENTAIGINSVTVSDTGIMTQTAERMETGISLRVTPQMNEDDYITLIIEPIISRPSDSKFFPGVFVDPQTTSVKTSVRVKNGETIMIGGLITNEEAETKRRVPFLGRIPILSIFFKSSTNSVAKRELMIFITPRSV